LVGIIILSIFFPVCKDIFFCHRIIDTVDLFFDDSKETNTDRLTMINNLTNPNNSNEETLNVHNSNSTSTERIQVTPNIKKENVTITNTSIEIRHEGKPTSGSAEVTGYVYLNIDCSSSMYGYKLQQAKKGACNFAREALTKNYLTGLIKFDSLATLIFEPCKDISFIESQINTLKVGSTTNLEAAIYLSSNLLKGLSGPKAIVIVTDGMPNSPGDPQSSLKAGEIAKSQQIDIIAIGTDDASRGGAFGQEVAAFPDNWTIGMSFYHNLFTREHFAACRERLLPGGLM